MYVSSKLFRNEWIESKPWELEENLFLRFLHRAAADINAFFGFIGPQMARAYRLDAISQGPKKSISSAQLLSTCPRNVSARIKNITHGAVQIIGA